MVQLLQQALRKDKIFLRVERRINGETWFFDTIVPRSHWEDLFHVNAPEGRSMETQGAYDEAREFWDYLAEKVANGMEQRVTKGAANRHEIFVWPDFTLLGQEYNQCQSVG